MIRDLSLGRFTFICLYSILLNITCGIGYEYLVIDSSISDSSIIIENQLSNNIEHTFLTFTDDSYC